MREGRLHSSHLKVAMWCSLLLMSAGLAGAQQLPPGTSSSITDSERRAAPSAADMALQRAEDAIAAGRYADAITVLTPMATSSRTNERVFYDLGFAQDALGVDAAAATAYKAAVALNANDVAARLSLGLLLARGRDLPGAETQLKAAAGVQGAPPELVGKALRALAQIHLEGQSEQARADMTAALKLSPETPQDTLLVAEIAVALGDDATAEKAYARAMTAAPAPDTALDYARVLEREGKATEAKQVLTSALKVNSSNPRLRAELASVELKAGRAAEALPLLESAYAADKGNMPVARLLARTYVANGTPERGNDLYAALMAAMPDDPELMSEAADSLIRQRQSAEAEKVLQRALARPELFKSKASLGKAAEQLAFAASQTGNYEVVLQAVATHEKVLPSDAAILFLSSVAHDRLHNTRQAVDGYRRFLQVAGGKFPGQELQARERLRTLDHAK